MEFNLNEKKFLQRLGRTGDGRELLAIFKHAKEHFSSITGIDPKGDYGAQVEGRKLFLTFVDAISNEIKTQERPPKNLDPEDYE